MFVGWFEVLVGLGEEGVGVGGACLTAPDLACVSSDLTASLIFALERVDDACRLPMS